MNSKLYNYSIIIKYAAGGTNLKQQKTQVFIASSKEGIDVAYAIQELLEHSAECTVWTQGVFKPSSYTLIDLIENAKEKDFGVFVFSLDDTVTIRNDKKLSIRDNVLLEFGLFVGAIGLERCFIILPNDVEKFHLPTDLNGLTFLTYNPNRRDKNVSAALGPASNKIKKALTSNMDEKKPIKDSLQFQINASGLNEMYLNRDDYNRFRKDASSIDKYINTATKDVVIVSISLSTGIQFDDICEIIEKRLKEQDDFSITISLLSPFQTELYVSLESMFGLDFSELQNQTKSSLNKLNELKRILPESSKKRFSINVHKTLPFASAILLDADAENGKIQIETKPYKVGMRKSFAMEFINNGGDFYNTLKDSYYELINDGEPFDD